MSERPSKAERFFMLAKTIRAKKDFETVNGRSAAREFEVAGGVIDALERDNADFEDARSLACREWQEAENQIAALTAEVRRLRGLLDDVRTDMTRRGQGGACNGCGEFADDGCAPHCLFTEIDAVLTPPDLTKCPDCNGPADQGFSRDVPPVPYSCSKCEPEQPAPATPDHFSDAGKMVEPPPGADARTDDGRFVSGTGYGGERR